jgi:diguanylate cyclase (GGDEF)-like protein/PAS domain S-box-containing protein
MLRARRAMDDLRRSEERLAEAQRNAGLGHWDWHPATGEMLWSEETRRLLGSDHQGALTLPVFLERLHPDDRGPARSTLEAAAAGGTPEGVDLRVDLGDGRMRHLNMKAMTRVDESGAVTAVSGTVLDVSERKDSEQRIRLLAFYDGLTGLPNRTLFLERLRIAMQAARRDGSSVAILLLDLDRFKHINDTFGHGTGDALLQEAAERLRTALRSSDSLARVDTERGGDTVARLGGDEFLASVTGLNRPNDAARISRRVLASLEKPFHIEGYELFVTGSIGITMYPHDGEDPETLIKSADSAMYQAKQAGRNAAHFYDHRLHEASVRKLSLENRLRHALERDELVVYFQPLMDVGAGSIVGAEALVRWIHPERGLLPPGEFIEIAEETGLIVPMGNWILRTALAEARIWEKSGHGRLRVSINLSARQFKERHLAEQIGGAVRQSGLPPDRVELEITESLLMYNTEEAVRILQELRGQGLGIALDDFGTGYSSLSYLLKFPISALKIDRLFVKEICMDPRSAAVTSSIVAMAGGLGLSLIAEGVETQEQADALRLKGCSLMQGYLFGRPMPASEFRTLLASRSSSAGEAGAAGTR